MPYTAPLDDMMLMMETVAVRRRPRSPTAYLHDSGEARDILEQAARFASRTVAPLNQQGDKWGAIFEDGAVSLPDGWREAYILWARSGWNAVSLPESHGGSGMPVILNTMSMEMLTAANMAFSTLPVLTQGAVDALEAHASDALKALYLPHLVSGTWTATMNLTEPQAGSDLAQIRTRAEPAGDGSYRITGSKIFITFGEHTITENIVHLVLARLPDAPEGTKGISLFLVPKFIPDQNGRPGTRNDLRCTGIEHKLGIKASPTCSMSFGDHGGARGWLIGHPHNGLACMFTMMNKARLATGLQGVAIADRAAQKALRFAAERRQGRAAGISGPAPIHCHPDVQRMLGRMQVLTALSRALAYMAAEAIDAATTAETDEQRKEHELRAGMLTPIVKAFCTDAGVDVASLGVQVHGGMGFIEETGAAQYYRDARIAPIYEGTNGIQAIDLVMRKLGRGGTPAMARLLDEARDTVVKASWLPGWAAMGSLIGAAAATTEWMGATQRTETEKLFAASNYLRLCALALGGSMLVACGSHAAEGPLREKYRALACIFAVDFAPEADSLAATIPVLGTKAASYARLAGVGERSA